MMRLLGISQKLLWKVFKLLKKFLLFSPACKGFFCLRGTVFQSRMQIGIGIGNKDRLESSLSGVLTARNCLFISVSKSPEAPKIQLPF